MGKEPFLRLPDGPHLGPGSWFGWICAQHGGDYEIQPLHILGNKVRDLRSVSDWPWALRWSSQEGEGERKEWICSIKEKGFFACVCFSYLTKETNPLFIGSVLGTSMAKITCRRLCTLVIPYLYALLPHASAHNYPPCFCTLLLTSHTLCYAFLLAQLFLFHNRQTCCRD